MVREEVREGAREGRGGEGQCWMDGWMDGWRDADEVKSTRIRIENVVIFHLDVDGKPDFSKCLLPLGGVCLSMYIAIINMVLIDR